MIFDMPGELLSMEFKGVREKFGSSLLGARSSHVSEDSRLPKEANFRSGPVDEKLHDSLALK
jgi:hypothetical protein